MDQLDELSFEVCDGEPGCCPECQEPLDDHHGVEPCFATVTPRGLQVFKRRAGLHGWEWLVYDFQGRELRNERH